MGGKYGRSEPNVWVSFEYHKNQYGNMFQIDVHLYYIKLHVNRTYMDRIKVRIMEN